MVVGMVVVVAGLIVIVVGDSVGYDSSSGVVVI